MAIKEEEENWRPGCPLLAYHHGVHRQLQTFCSVSCSGPVFSESQSIPELRNKTILYSSPDGDWLLLLHVPEYRDRDGSRRRQLSIWSPKTDESIDLPGVDSAFWVEIEGGLLSSSPLHPTCLVILLYKNSPLIVYCRVGDEKWSKFDYAKTIQAQLRDRLPNITQGTLVHPVVLDDKMYACTAYDHYFDLVQIIIDDDDLDDCKTLVVSLDSLRSRQSSDAGKFTSFLVPNGGDLYLVLISTNSLDFEYHQGRPQVYRFDFLLMVWRAVTSLNGGGTIFLGNSYSISCHGNSNNKKWSYIYFTCKNSPRLYIYRVEDERITSYLPFDLPSQLSEPWVSHWIIVPQPAIDIHEHEQKSNSVTKCSGDHIKNSMAALIEYLSRNRNARRQRMIDMESSSFCDLPQKVLALIAGNLSSFVDYIHFRCVNKVCASATIGTRSRTNPFLPCLIYKDRVHGVYNMVDSNLNHKLSFEIPNGLDDHKICCSRDGWLLLEKPTSCNFTFLNPLTGQVIPRRGEYGYAVSNLTFSGKPDSPDSFVLAMSNKGLAKGIDDSRTGWKTFMRGSEHRWEFGGGGGGGYSSPVWLGESCYYLGNHGGLLGRFQLAKDGAFHWEIARITLPSFRPTQTCLTECGGELVSIFVGDDRVRVFKLNHEEWREIDSLGGYSLYISSPSCVSYLAERPETANRIYFPKFYNDGLVYYSLCTRKYHSLGNQDDVELHDFCATSMYPTCTWIQPNWG